MKSLLLVAALLCVSVILQSTWLSSMNPKFDGVLAITMAVAFLRGRDAGAVTGFFGGLLQDGLSGMSHGGFGLTGALTGFVFGSFLRWLNSKNLLVFLLGTLLGAFFHYLIMKLWMEVLGITQPLALNSSIFWGGLLLQSLLCIVLVIPGRSILSPESLEL